MSLNLQLLVPHHLSQELLLEFYAHHTPTNNYIYNSTCAEEMKLYVRIVEQTSNGTCSLSFTSSKQNGRMYCPVNETGRSEGKGIATCSNSFRGKLVIAGPATALE